MTTLPRQALALEYRLLRMPTQLLQTKVVARYLDDDNPSRLGFERVLGAADGFAGRLLHDERLTTRGTALRRRVELLTAADALTAQAKDQRQQSQRELQETEGQARKERERAVEHEREQVRQAREEAAAAKTEARQRAEEEERAAAERAEETKKRTVQAARTAAEKRTAAIEERTERATAAPKTQLRKASATRASARQKREDAQALGALSARERANRKRA